MILSILPAIAAFAASTALTIPAPVAPAPATISSLKALQEPMESQFNYDYVEGELVFGEAFGFKVAGSYNIQDNLYGTGRIQYLTDDESGIDVDLVTLSAGATYVIPLQEGLDFLGTGELEYGRAKASGRGVSASDSEVGIFLRGGVRYAIDPKLEAFGGLNLHTIFDSDFSVDGGVR